jgi:asparagine synthase (glutamine-hydrolysing)
MPNSEDAKYARMVANHLGTKHTEIVLTENEFFDAIPDVIKAIESYDTTTVRASVGNYLVAKYISQNSDAKVILNGDGSDEVCGGYMYFHKAPSSQIFDTECHNLLDFIYCFDVLRSDKSISSNGLEPRTPFLDKEFVDTYLSLPAEWRFHAGNGECEKYFLRKSFDRDNLLPKEVLWRTKEAFSDGVSNQKRSWFEIINEKIIEKYGEQFCNKTNKDNVHNSPKTPEQRYYRYLFEQNYYNMGHVLPYFWMPKFVNASDSSARTLKEYSDVLNRTNKKDN